MTSVCRSAMLNSNGMNQVLKLVYMVYAAQTTMSAERASLTLVRMEVLPRDFPIGVAGYPVLFSPLTTSANGRKRPSILHSCNSTLRQSAPDLKQTFHVS